MANKRKKYGIRENESLFYLGKFGGKTLANGWIEKFKRTCKPGQTNPYIALLAARKEFNDLTIDIKGELGNQIRAGYKIDGSNSIEANVGMNNTFALLEVFALQFIPIHLSNLIIVKNETIFKKTDSADVKRGLGTNGEVVDIKSAAVLYSEYKDLIDLVKTKETSLTTTPVLMNRESMLLIYEDVKATSTDSIIHLQAAIIRPNIMDRLSNRFKENTTTTVINVLGNIMSYTDFVKYVKAVFNLPEADINFVYTIENTVVEFDDAVVEKYTESGFTLEEDPTSTVSKEDCFYILNPALLNELNDYRQEMEEAEMKKDYIALSDFKDKIGKDTTAYLSEIVKDGVDAENNKTEEGDEDEAKYDLFARETFEVELVRDANLTFNEVDLVFVDNGCYTTRSLEKLRKNRALNIEDEETLETERTGKTQTDVYESKVDFVYGVTSLDPMFSKSTGLKNSGYYSTVDVSVAETIFQMKTFVSGVFSNNKTSSKVIDFVSRLIDVTNSRNGVVQDIMAADFYGMTTHFIDTVRADYMAIAANRNYFTLIAGEKIDTKRILVARDDIHCVDTSIDNFNKNGQVKVGSYYDIDTTFKFKTADRLPNGIGYVLVDAAGNMIDASVMTEVKLPKPSGFPTKSTTLKNRTISVLVDSNADVASTVEGYFDGYTYNKNQVNLNVTLKDLVDGVDVVTPLKGAQGLKEVINKEIESTNGTNVTYEKTIYTKGQYIAFNERVLADSKSVIFSVIPKAYKKERTKDHLDMFENVMTEIIFSKKVNIEKDYVNLTRKIIKEPTDIYGIIKSLESTDVLDIEASKFGGFIDLAEQKRLIDYKLVGNEVKVSAAFKKVYGEVATAIKEHIQREFNDNINVIDQIAGMDQAMNNFQRSLRDGVRDSLKDYNLIEKLFILDSLFS